MIPVEEARRRMLAAFRPLPAETVSLPEALGRVLAADVPARLTQPWAAVSAMDGFAVRAADVAAVPATLTRVGEVPAGGSFDRPVGPGECVRIFTGAPLPAGADAIVIQEDAEADGARVTVRAPVAAGRYVRPAGLDFREGDVLLRAGRVLTARDVGLAAAMNVPWLAVRRRPRVAILATGDEIVLPGEPIGPSQIVSSNGPALAALVTACGGVPIQLGIARDDRQSLAAMAAGGRDTDLLITTGGASVGEHDLIRDVLGAEGLELDFWKIAMRPGKPLMFGRIGGTPLLGLPGNPVSSMVCAILFARPILRALSGVPDEDEGTFALSGRDLAANDRRQDYLRATLVRNADGMAVATPFDVQDSSMMSLLAKADCLVVRPPEAPAAKAGERVPIVPFAAGIQHL
ncbi:MAG TPA: gephyrin-like molybdotransferase Glp [Alphaproteobacteria bacterium]|nr:gephyrin-like molybdotransferase Glp [Alphaproteobacteria bacterium]